MSYYKRLGCFRALGDHAVVEGVFTYFLMILEALMENRSAPASLPEGGGPRSGGRSLLLTFL